MPILRCPDGEIKIRSVLGGWSGNDVRPARWRLV